jgi:hypothetical protein
MPDPNAFNPLGSCVQCGQPNLSRGGEVRCSCCNYPAAMAAIPKPAPAPAVRPASYTGTPAAVHPTAPVVPVDKVPVTLEVDAYKPVTDIKTVPLQETAAQQQARKGKR